METIHSNEPKSVSFNLNLLLCLSIILGLIALLPTRALSAQPTDETIPNDKPNQCTYTREYVTTTEYLKSHPEYSLPNNIVKETALKVAEACTGSAKRFVKIMTTLGTAGVHPKDAMNTALEFTKKSDIETDTFLHVFITGFREDKLDMDLMSSLRLARSLTTEFQGDSLRARNNFDRLLEFCIGEGELNLPRPQCGLFAARITQQEESYASSAEDKELISKSFIKLYDFLISSSGPSLTRGQAMTTTEKILTGGVHSADNFIQAFKYASSNSGESLNNQEAILFAENMALMGLSSRQPASAQSTKKTTR